MLALASDVIATSHVLKHVWNLTTRVASRIIHYGSLLQ